MLAKALWALWGMLAKSLGPMLAKTLERAHVSQKLMLAKIPLLWPMLAKALASSHVSQGAQLSQGTQGREGTHVSQGSLRNPC